jgi:hypothetical protein
VFFGNVLHVTDEFAVLDKPCLPGLPGFIEGTWQIVRLPDALVLLRQGVLGVKVALHPLAAKSFGIPEQAVNVRPFPFPEHLGRMGTLTIAQTVSMEHGCILLTEIMREGRGRWDGAQGL